MEIKKIQNKKTEVVTDVICDCCGKSCKVSEGKIDNSSRVDNGETYYEFEFMEMKAHWGYHTRKDMEEWVAQICEKCIDEKFTFVKFKKSEYGNHFGF